MNYSLLLSNLIAEMKEGTQYKRIPNTIRWLLIIAMIPLIVSFVFLSVLYYIQLFFFKALSAPAEYLHSWLKGQKDEVKHATQAVIYFLCIPFIFFLQILLSLSSVAFFFSWFFLMLNGYLLTLGGIRWQPFITDATFEPHEITVTKPQQTVAVVFSCCIFGVSVIIVLFIILGLIGLADVETFVTFFNAIYWVGVLLVNPILFKVEKKPSADMTIVNSDTETKN